MSSLYSNEKEHRLCRSSCGPAAEPVSCIPTSRQLVASYRPCRRNVACGRHAAQVSGHRSAVSHVASEWGKM
jgi:hypothetical protein